MRLSNLLTSGPYIYALVQNLTTTYELYGYHASDSSYSFKYPLKDKKGNFLTIGGIGNDPVTGNLFVSGCIRDANIKKVDDNSPKDFAKGIYGGIYTINVNGPKTSDVKEVFSYWNNGSQSLFDIRGKNQENDTYTKYKGSFRDYQGNTYFFGTSYIKKAKVGSIISSIITLPLLVPPIWISFGGYSKVKIQSSTLLKQNAKGSLSIENTVEGDKGRFYPTITGWAFDTRNYYYALDPERKNTNLIINDKNNIFIYSINAKKVIRTIPHKDGNTLTEVFPAKEGHIMVSEYNKIERATTVSIESL